MNADTKSLVIAVDAMGGDHAPKSVLHGIAKVAAGNSDVSFRVYGNKVAIDTVLQQLPKLKSRVEIFHTDVVIASDEKPSVALRKGKHSSIRLAINAVKEGQAHAMISGGNTGALMAMAKLVLRTIPGVDRPAIASVFPARKGRCVLLDLGANIDCNADNLIQFAIMGHAFARVLLNKEHPTVGLLNVGSEEVKGSDVVKTAAEELRSGDYDIDFYGYVEGNDIAEGTSDVVVMDGFTGNVVLKTAEGTARICGDYIRQAFGSSPFAWLGGVLAKRAIKKMFKSMDPRLHNGAMFLGLNGIAVKSHGGSDAIGFANALEVAISLAKEDINSKVIQEMVIDDQAADIDIPAH